jgi:hypothetical protein
LRGRAETVNLNELAGIDLELFLNGRDQRQLAG